MTLDSDTVDAFTQDIHRRVGELMKMAEPTVEEINRLFFLQVVCENQARDFRKAAERRVRMLQEARRKAVP